MSRLQLKNIHKKYHEKIIVDNINLEIEKGEFIVVVGPSGCGKSTLLRMIAGLEEITAGEISLDNKVINNYAPKDRNIAMVFQNYALYPHMTVYNNMAYGLKMHGFKKAEIELRVNEAAKILEIEEFLARKPNQLSGGQRQRVAMGRAIVRRPKVYLFDEPLSNLDAKLRIQMRLEIKKLHKNFNITSIYVTHDQMEAMTLADRLVVLNKGAVEQIGPPIEVYQTPKSMFVAGFIGSPPMNFLPVNVSQDGHTIEMKDISITMKQAMLKQYCNEEIVLGIRPEHFSDEPVANAIKIKLNIDLWEHLGADTLVYGTIGSLAKTITVRLPEKWHPTTEKFLDLWVKPEDLHYFDKNTKKRINLVE